MNTSWDDKGELEGFLQDGCKVSSGEEAFEVCLRLLPNLGSEDAVIRDSLTFTILAKMIWNEALLTGQQLGMLLQAVIDETGLFFRIGESGTDSVFKRAFSILVVAAILARDNRDEVLSQPDIDSASKAIFRYGHEEQDKRGYVPGKGWAHSVAHTADALDSCIQNRLITVEQRDEALDVLRHLIMTDSYLVHDEDGRLASTVFRIIKFERVDRMILEDWLAGFAEKTYGLSLEPSPMGWNAQNFLRRLYLGLEWHDVNDAIKEYVGELLRRVDGMASLT